MYNRLCGLLRKKLPTAFSTMPGAFLYSTMEPVRVATSHKNTLFIKKCPLKHLKIALRPGRG
jgi:hypothetical protein